MGLVANDTTERSRFPCSGLVGNYGQPHAHDDEGCNRKPDNIEEIVAMRASRAANGLSLWSEDEQGFDGSIDPHPTNCIDIEAMKKDADAKDEQRTRRKDISKKRIKFYNAKRGKRREAARD